MPSGEDPTEPEHSTPYPYLPLSHEPAVERLAVKARSKQGLHRFHVQRHAPAVNGRAARGHYGRRISLI